MADAQHVGGKLLAVLYVQPEELVEVGEDRLFAGESVGGAEDGDHFETFAVEVVAGVEVRRGVTGDCYTDSGADLATLDGVGRGGFELGRSRSKGGHLNGVGE